jgi:hypothetical protein
MLVGVCVCLAMVLLGVVLLWVWLVMPVVLQLVCECGSRPALFVQLLCNSTACGISHPVVYRWCSDRVG